MPKPLRPFYRQKLTIGGEIVTAIIRAWRPGDTRRCCLCSSCGADHDNNFCGVLTTTRVGPSEGAMYKCRGPMYKCRGPMYKCRGPMYRADGKTIIPPHELRPVD